MQFFDITEFLPHEISKEVLQLLNARISTIQEKYNRALYDLEAYLRKLNDKIGCFYRLEKLGNIGITFDEMNSDSVIEKLRQIDVSSEKIWQAFDKHYNKGFFYPEIEKEFGITPQTHENLVAEFDRKVAIYRDSAESQI